MSWKNPFICLVTCISLAFPLMSHAEEKYAVYYSDKAPIEELSSYNVLVLDSDAHPSLSRLKDRGKMVLGYISLGEVAKERFYFSEAKSKGLLLEQNANWPGSYAVNIRNPEWAKMVIEDIIPKIVEKGFQGIFIDTLDTPLALEQRNPAHYQGMSDAAVALVKGIHLHYPYLTLMVNRAYPILPKIAGNIQMVMGESVYSDYDFTHKRYGLVANATYKQQVAYLKDAQKHNKALKIYTLDYAEKQDKPKITHIYQEQRRNGFIPYVATIGLDEIVKEPQQ